VQPGPPGTPGGLHLSRRELYYDRDNGEAERGPLGRAVHVGLQHLRQRGRRDKGRDEHQGAASMQQLAQAQLRLNAALSPGDRFYRRGCRRHRHGGA